PRAGGRSGSQEARGAPPPDPAARSRQGDVHSTFRASLPERRWSPRRGVGVRADQPAQLLRALRGSEAQGQVMPLLVVDDLATYFYTRRGVTRAVDGVSFTLDAGETLALVGESGSGKSVTCLSLVRLVPEPAGRIVRGRVLLDGEDLLRKSAGEMRHVRGKQIAMVLQDPMTSLNPGLTIGTQVGEVLRLHQGVRGRTLRDRV